MGDAPVRSGHHADAGLIWRIVFRIVDRVHSTPPLARPFPPGVQTALWQSFNHVSARLPIRQAFASFNQNQVGCQQVKYIILYIILYIVTYLTHYRIESLGL